jgi:lycopene cyclase domain-containing protein
MFGAYLITIIWDHLFTILKVWGFNTEYYMGIEFWELPLEEHLFFFTIPYSCVFIYEVLNYYMKKDYIGRLSRIISIALVLGLPMMAWFNFDKLYTVTVALFCETILIHHLLVFRSHKRYMGRFYMAFFVSLIPFFIINGVLTSLPIIWYDDQQNLGMRIGTIPVEDILYNLFLFLSVITIYEHLKKKATRSVNDEELEEEGIA